MEKLEQVYNEYYMTLVYFATKYTKDRMAAEDIVSDLFVEKRMEIENSPNTSIRALLFISTKNLCINHIKGIIRHIKAHKRIFYSLEEQDFSYNVAESSFIGSLFNEIQNLSIQRKTILISYLQGKKTKTIAKELNINAQTVRNLKTLAISDLRKLALNHQKTIK